MKVRTDVPNLRINAVLYPDGNVPLRRRIFQRVVWNLLHYMTARGYVATAVYGGDEPLKSKNLSDLMEEIFDLDEVAIGFSRVLSRSKVNGRPLRTHTSQAGSVEITFWNDVADMVSDWRWADSPWGREFSKVVESFKPEAWV